jgi:hypothetical protein
VNEEALAHKTNIPLNKLTLNCSLYYLAKSKVLPPLETGLMLITQPPLEIVKGQSPNDLHIITNMIIPVAVRSKAEV